MLDIESLLAPLSDEAPSGADLEYDASFIALEAAGVGKAEQQYGDTLIPAEPPDWRTVQEQAVALAARTRDLRVAVWLTRSGARLQGFAGAVDGLRLVHGLLRDRWQDVYPQLDASDGNDPTMRLNALLPLVTPDSFLADLRSVALTGTRGSITVRAIELGLGAGAPAPDEQVPSEAGVLEAVRAALEQEPGLTGSIDSALQAVEGMASLLDQQLGAGVGPDLQPLVKLVRSIDAARGRAQGQDAGDPDRATGAQMRLGQGIGAGGAPGSIDSRDDVVRTLERLCEWIERNEPSNPAPLLLRRAQRLMSKNFIDIVRDLAPESLAQIERLAGIESDSG